VQNHGDYDDERDSMLAVRIAFALFFECSQSCNYYGCMDAMYLCMGVYVQYSGRSILVPMAVPCCDFGGLLCMKATHVHV